MKYSEVRRDIIKSENLIMGNLPTFCNSDRNKAINDEQIERNIKEILNNNGY